jgi:hypothetical protein
VAISTQRVTPGGAVVKGFLRVEIATMARGKHPQTRQGGNAIL